MYECVGEYPKGKEAVKEELLLVLGWRKNVDFLGTECGLLGKGIPVYQGRAIAVF